MTASRRRLRDLSLLVLCLAIFGLGVWWLAPVKPAKITLKMSAGSQLGTRHALALQLSEVCRAHGMELKVIPTDGSEQALRQVNEGQIDLAFVQGGLIGQRYQHVTEVAPLHLEPLHLLAKANVAAVLKSDGLAALGGRVINTGSPGSGTHALATLVLRFLGLQSSDAQAARAAAVEIWPNHFNREPVELR